MTRDVKLIQRGVNVQANDMAVPAGTPLRAVNIDYSRDGVAQRRVGFESFYAGLPPGEIDDSIWDQSYYTNNQIEKNRGFFELFSRDRLFCQTSGFIFSYDEIAARWMSVPVNLPHKYTLFGGGVRNGGYDGGIMAGFGRALVESSVISGCSPFRWQDSLAGGNRATVYGCINNSTSEVGTRFNDPKDFVSYFSGLLTDGHAIRNQLGAVVAGSITASGTTDAVTTAARFSSPSYMSMLGAYLYIVDNVNQIRRYDTSSGSVTTFVGSTTAGDVNGTGTVARFRTISGITNNGTDLFVVESGGQRVRKITTAGVVTTLSGLLTPVTAGYADSSTASLVRFSTPVGIEWEEGSNKLFIGDTLNNVVRSVSPSTGASETIAGTGLSGVDGIVGGLSTAAILPGASVRGLYGTSGIDMYVVVECTTASSATMDVALVSTGNAAGFSLNPMPADSCNVFHIVRCPSSLPNITTGPTKFDSVGPAAYGLGYTRGVDAGGGVVFTTSERPRVIDIWTRLKSTDPVPRFRTLGVNSPEAPSVTTTTGTTFAASMSWAYRTVCGLKLPDGKIAIGPPSERIICVGSTTATCSGSVTAFPSPALPYDGMPFVQVYRTRAVANTLDPGDQMFLCYESALTYGDGIVFTDQLTDDLLGAELYTNATSDGIAASSLPPPGFVGDVASFGDRVVLGNTVPLATVRVKCLGATTLVAATSTLTITTQAAVSFSNAWSLTLTATAGVTNPNTNVFQIGTGGTATQNAVQTARNIVRCINRGPDAYIYRADYDESDPGAFVITCLYSGMSPKLVGYSTVAGSSVALTKNQCAMTIGGTALGTAFITIEQNVSTRQQNALVYSDQKAFDSFPVVNAITVGPSTEAIQRLLPISDTLLAVKDDSIWRMDAGFVPQIYDTALTCETPGSFAKVNNQWIGLFTRGFVALNSSAAVALGRNIDRDVVANYSMFYGSLTAPFASAAAIDVTGNYLCTVNRKTYCYNAIVKAWSEWQVNVLASQYPDGGTSTVNQDSGILSVGAFRDGFIVSNPSTRSVGRQRNYSRTSTSWYKSYSDFAYTMSGTVSAGAQAITASLVTASNPGSYSPYVWTPPTGAIVDANNAAASFCWAFELVQGATTEVAQGTISQGTGSATQSITITLTTALTSIVAGALTSITAYPPIICRVQYAPSAAPGSNAMFGDMLVTVERCQPGWLIARFFNRNDFGNASIPADGDYLDTYGVSRATLMASITTSNSSGLGSLYAYHDPQRFFVPSERATDQVLGVEIWEGNAWQPFAIKSISPDKRATENAKVVR